MGKLKRVGCAWRKEWREWLTFAAFVLPNLALFAVFTYYPILHSAWLSLTNWDFISPVAQFIGLANYARLLTDGDFWRVLANTFVYAFSVVLAAQGLAFGLALLLNRRLPGQAFFRTVAFLPQVTMTAAAALVGVLLLDPKLGPLSVVYTWLETGGVRFLASSALALWAIVLVGIWREVGFASFFFLAGLQGIDPTLYEAARVDGASPLRILRHVTLPLMSPVVFFLALSGLIQAVKMFDLVAIMTEGGPVYPASATFVYHLYKLAFRDVQAGYASAFAVVFFLLTAGMSLAQFRLAQRWVHYE